VGYRPVFVAGGVAALAGLASVPWLPRPGRAAGPSTGILAALSLIAVPAVVVAGAAVFGAGFGVTQNASLTIMYAALTVSN
jgi:hypothetical protein